MGALERWFTPAHALHHKDGKISHVTQAVLVILMEP